MSIFPGGAVVAVSARAAPESASVQATPPRLDVLRLDLVFAIDEEVLMPANRANLWRGVFGAALMRIDEGVLPGVSTGSLPPGNLYRSFFEPEGAAGVIGGVDLRGGAPHPYVVDAPGTLGDRVLATGSDERIGLTLIGRPASAVEAVLAAFDFAARAGLGLGEGRDWRRGRARLVEAQAVWRNDGVDRRVFGVQGGFRPIASETPAIPPCPPRLRVILATPLRLLRQGKIIEPHAFRPAMLLSSLARRVSSLAALYGTPVDADYTELKRLWEGLVAEQPSLAFKDQIRWSGNHRKEIEAGGVVGSFILDMRGREALFPYLWFGQWLHAGKGVVGGLGALRLRPA